MFYFFVSFPIIAVQPAIYNSYFRKICHGLRSFLKKNPAKQDSPPAAGRVSDILPFRRSAIRAERFLSYRNEVSYTIKRMCLGTFSRRGAVALATIYPCAECASSRSIFIVWKRSFLYDKTKIPDRHESFSSTSVGNSIFNTTDLCSAHLLFFSSACLLQQAIVVSPSERYLPDVPEHRFP